MEAAGSRLAISDRYAPSAEQRALLTSRRDALIVATGRADPVRIKQMVAALRLGLKAQATTEAGAAAALELNIRALAHFPEWTVSEACRRFNNGEAGEGTFVPTPAELANECRALLAPVHDELTKLRRVLDAEVYVEPTAEQRGRIADGMDALIADLKRSNVVQGEAA